MAIERLSFPKHLQMKNGIALASGDISTLQSQVDGLLARFGTFSERLAEGNYDITPNVLLGYQAQLTVMRSGIGLVRMIPQHGYAATSANVDGRFTEPVFGGRQIALCDEQKYFAILASANNGGLNHLYELIFHQPEPNPNPNPNPNPGRFTV